MKLIVATNWTNLALPLHVSWGPFDFARITGVDVQIFFWHFYFIREASCRPKSKSTEASTQ